jgi:thiosulfate dehydrogenase [quinone] large subunit
MASMFLFASYAKLTYPGFLDPHSSFGFHSAVESAKQGNTPLGFMLGPMVDHTSFFGHLTAFAELAIGLGLLFGAVTRVAAGGGMLLTATIALTINWPEIKQYTGNGGWFTSVDLLSIAALSVFLLGGPGPLSIDATFWAWLKRRQAQRRARDEAEARFGYSEADLEDSRRRLRGEPTGYPGGRTQYPAAPSGHPNPGAPDQLTTELPAPGQGAPPGRYGGPDDDDLHFEPEPADDGSLWNAPRGGSNDQDRR